MHIDLRATGLIACAAGSLCLGLPALAQTEDEASPPAEGGDPAATSGQRIYYPADFAQYAPRSALDMVQQIPGFTVDGGNRGNNQERGLGQASGNVLLNGERLAAKSSSLTDQLQRIPADNVIRIELVDGSTLDVPGLSGRVANIIARSTGGTQLQFEWNPQLAAENSRNRWLSGRVSASGSAGPLAYTMTVEGLPVRNGAAGINRITYADDSVEERTSTNQANGKDTKYSTTLKYDLPSGAIASFHGSLLLRRFRAFADEQIFTPTLPPELEQIRIRNKGYDYELGGDFDFDLGPGRLRLIGLERYTRLRNGTRSVIDPATGDPLTGSLFNRWTQTGERIGRFEYGWAMLGGDWQWSGEAAFNRLDRVSRLFSLDPGGEFVEIPFPSGTGGVTEDRYETRLSYGRPLTDLLSLQANIGGEYSQISQTGSNALSRTFLRPKGSLALSWTPTDTLDISVRAERAVGQLDFGDFLAEVNLGDDNQNEANNQLRPSQQWRFDLEFTRDFGAWGNANLRFFYRINEDFVTIVPSPTGGSATGNVDKATIRGLEFIGTLQLDPLGITGARLDVTGQMRRSAYQDPVVGGRIPIQFVQPRNLELAYRHDLPGSDWAYGGNFRITRYNPYYRVEEYGDDYSIANNLELFIEHKDVFGLTMQAKLTNILEKESVLDRYVFDGPRGSSPFLYREYRVREVGKVVSFTVKGSF